MTTRILLADDHALVRRGLRQVIEKEPGLEVVAEASDGAEAVAKAEAADVDLAILDIAMPRMTGLQAAEQLAQRRPRTRVILLSMYDTDQYMLAAARIGAAGYLLKSMADEEIVDACHAVVRGRRFLYPATVGARTRERLERLQRGEDADAEVLTPRELEVLKLVGEGHSSRAIADTLVISIKTVEHHRANILEKLGVHDRVGLTRYAIRRGLVEP
ncbi:MAG TPA: response regulator transcription factor [Gaiellaceae bacterium]